MYQTFCVEMPKEFHATVYKEGKWFVSECKENGVTSQGKTKASALVNLKDAVEAYLKVTSGKHTYNQFLF